MSEESMTYGRAVHAQDGKDFQRCALFVLWVCIVGRTREGRLAIGCRDFESCQVLAGWCTTQSYVVPRRDSESCKWRSLAGVVIAEPVLALRSWGVMDEECWRGGGVLHSYRMQYAAGPFYGWHSGSRSHSLPKQHQTLKTGSCLQR